jgi:serine/threonine protein kinase
MADRTLPSASSTAQRVASTLEVGQTLGARYVIEQRISEGSFGEVFRASDRQIRSHQVALKLLRRPAANEAERAEALRELMLIASVSHPSVVQFKDYGWFEDRLWFAMPWFVGRPLDKVLGSGASAVAMSRAEAKPIFVRIAEGLSAMHAVGIHHHDIKPENIFLAEIAGFAGGLPVLLDLGISTKRGENPKGLTVDYASPETAGAMLGTATGPIGEASDVYSLALVLRNALEPSLVENEASGDVMARLLRRATQPVALPTTRDLRYLAPYFARWLHMDPAQRPSASQFADQLAILTAPEEKRDGRLKVLKRYGPVALIALLLIAVLVWRVRTQRALIRAKNQTIQAEQAESEELQDQLVTKLAELERTGQSLGNERQQREQALALGRSLADQLATAGKRNDTLRRKVAALTTERDTLTVDKAALTTERDGLLRDKQTLTAERDGLLQEKRGLIAERDGLLEERRRLSAERDGLLQERQTLTAERNRLADEGRALTASRDALAQEKAALTAERDALVQDKRALAAEIESLRAQLDELRNRQAPAAAPPPSP